MEISKYRESDLEEIVDLFLDTVHEINRKDYSLAQLNAWAPYERRQEIIESWQKTLREHISYVARCEHKIVGFADLTLDGLINRIYVHKDYQNRGIAKKLLFELEEEAYQLGLIHLDTMASTTAVPFFQHEGYDIVSEEIAIRNQIALQNFHMRKEL